LGKNFDTVLAIEKDNITMKCYNNIFQKNFNPIEIESVQLKDVPNSDLIVYSPPCQSFSTAGKKLGINDKRGLLFYEALKIIQWKKPKFAVMENVVGLTGKFKSEFEEMLTSLGELGYRNYSRVINAVDYGVPQNRRRVFVVSIRNDIDFEFVFKNKLNKTIKIEDLLELNPNKKYYIEHKDWVKDLLKNFNLFTMNTPTLVSFTRKKIREVKVCNTLMSNPPLRSLGNNTPITGVAEINNKEVKLRVLTPLEYWRINGFSDSDYNKALEVVSRYYKNQDHIDGKLYKLAGNSIVVEVLEGIFESLIK
jgi:DNA-cytosine methyltransferase